MANLRLVLIFIESTCLRLLAHQIWSLYLNTSQELGRGGGGLLATKIGISNSPTTKGLIFFFFEVASRN